jgi:hypothetical protein
MVKIRAALETALAAMGELVPSFSIVSSAPGNAALVTTTVPHKLKSGVSVTISDHVGATPNLNGSFLISVLSATTFTLLHKVTEAPFACTAGGVGGVCKANLTAWDNVSFKPVPGVPYQKVNLLFADPDDVTMGAGYYREHGFMQVSLFYPILLGTKDISAKADEIRAAFSRGASFEKDGVTVKIPRTAMVMTGMPIDESYAIPIRIPFQADIFR